MEQPLKLGEPRSPEPVRLGRSDVFTPSERKRFPDVVNFRCSPEMHAKVLRNGGGEWLRWLIERAE